MQALTMAAMSSDEFVEAVVAFDGFGKSTLLEPFEWEVDGRRGTTMKAINEYWTSGQRQANALHEISYRACFKPQLPAFFISRLTEAGDAVYDPFMGRGTTPLEARLLGRRPMGNDINPLSQVLLAPRLNPPSLKAIEARLDELDLSGAVEEHEDLLHFYHPETLREIIALKEYLLAREAEGTLDAVDAWIRMVAINRLTGHSSGFFSVYSLPPNQAVTAERQRKINEDRGQVPEYKAIKPRILTKSKSLLKGWNGVRLDAFDHDLRGVLSTSDSRNVPLVPDDSASLVVTSPPFLDVVDYQGDNWLRCWFIGIDSSTIEISQLKAIEDWEDTMTDVLKDLKRIVKPGGHIAFEVGEVRGGKVLLEEHVVRCGVKAGLEPVVIMINDQEFTKTANAWGVDNSKKGTNTNRIVVFSVPEESEIISAIKHCVLSVIKWWNAEALAMFEKLYGETWKDYFSKISPRQLTQEKTKMATTIFTNRLNKCLKRELGEKFEIVNDKSLDVIFNLDDGKYPVEQKLTTQPLNAKDHYWTGNHVSKKVGPHLLSRLEIDDDGEIIGVYVGLLELDQCKITNWSGKKGDVNYSTLKIKWQDRKLLQDILGKQLQQNSFIRFEYYHLDNLEEG
jgi:hypothetical protein